MREEGFESEVTSPAGSGERDLHGKFMDWPESVYMRRVYISRRFADVWLHALRRWRCVIDDVPHPPNDSVLALRIGDEHEALRYSDGVYKYGSISEGWYSFGFYTPAQFEDYIAELADLARGTAI